jgi:hypothetical protein
MSARVPELDRKIFETFRDYTEEQVAEVTMKYWDSLDEEMRIRLREKKRQIWEWLRRRNMEWREGQDGRVLDFIHMQGRRSARIQFRRYIKSFGPLLVKKYDKVALVEIQNWRHKYMGMRKEDQKYEVVNIKDIFDELMKERYPWNKGIIVQ